MEQSYIDSYVRYYTSPGWLAFILLFTTLMGFLGCMVGGRLIRRHFQKAGVCLLYTSLFYQYLQNNGEGVTFEVIAKPEWERGDHMTPLKKALEHEKFVTASIDAIYAAAYEAKDLSLIHI